MPKQLTLIVHLRVLPQDASKLVQAHAPVWAACAAEPECLFFDVFQDLEDRGKFRFVEVWSKDKKWFEEEQLTKEYYGALWERSRPLWIEEREFVCWEVARERSADECIVKIEYLERYGEGSIYRQGYLDGGKKMD